MSIDTNKKVKFLINFAIVLIIAGAAYLLLKYLLPWILPFLIGLGVAVLINKAARVLSIRLRLPQNILAIVLLALSLVAIALFMYLIGNQIYIQIQNFITQKVVTGELSDSLDFLLDKLSLYLTPDMRDSVYNVAKGQIGNIASGLTSFVGNLVMKMPSFFISLLISIIASFIISGDYKRISGFLWRQFPEKVKNLLPEIRNIMVNSVYKIIKAYLIIMLITFTELSIGLSVLGVKYSLAIAALTAVVDILPVLGSGTVLLPWAVLSVIRGDYPLAIGLAVLYALIIIVRQTIEPRVVGHSIGLHPIVTLMALYIGYCAFGIVGMFGLPILLIILKSFQDSDRLRIWKD